MGPGRLVADVADVRRHVCARIGFANNCQVIPATGAASHARHVGRRGIRRLSAESESTGAVERFWRWTAQERPSWKESGVEAAVAFTVFGITGSTSMKVVRPFLNPVYAGVTGLENDGEQFSLKNGPNSYRAAQVL